MTTLADRVVAVQPPPRQGLGSWTAFGICAAILVLVIASVWLTRTVLGVYLEKAPVFLHKPLSQMDKAQLGPYAVMDAKILSDEMVDALGTKDYIQWVLQDTRKDSGDPLRFAFLFVTYYTGGRNQVPHTPERCHLGVNWSIKTTWDIETAVPSVDGAPGEKVEVPARVIVFNKPGLFDVQERTVVYTFYANCGYAASREKIRFWLGRPGVAKSFFSKVEVTFAGDEMGISSPDPQKAAQAADELLQTVLPVLMRDHWPRKEELHKDPVAATR